MKLLDVANEVKNFQKRRSPIHGMGIFTLKPFSIGETVYEVPVTCVHRHPRSRCARIADDIYVDDESVLNWVNHSCDPSVMLDVRGLRLCAVRSIGIGEEITCDYVLTEENGNKVPCTCGTKKCRGFFLRVE